LIKHPRDLTLSLPFFRVLFLAKRVDLQLVWKTSLQDIVESPTLLKSISILTTGGTDGKESTHITLLVDGKIYFLRPEFLVRSAFKHRPVFTCLHYTGSATNQD